MVRLIPTFKVPDENERRRALERLPEKMKAEELAEHRKIIEKAQKRGAPPRFIEPRCKVCTSEHRNWIELQLARGYSATAIERIFEGSPNPIPRRSISNHAQKGHMSIEDSAMRAVIEHEADLEGKLAQEGVQEILTKKSILHVMARRGIDDVINGNTTVEPRDLIQIIRAINEMEVNSSSSAVEEARIQVQILSEAIRRACPDDIQAKILVEIKKLKNQYELDSVDKLLEAPSEREEISDAEVVAS
jgi:hypothetical protein